MKAGTWLKHLIRLVLILAAISGGVVALGFCCGGCAAAPTGPAATPTKDAPHPEQGAKQAEQSLSAEATKVEKATGTIREQATLVAPKAPEQAAKIIAQTDLLAASVSALRQIAVDLHVVGAGILELQATRADYAKQLAERDKKLKEMQDDSRKTLNTVLIWASVGLFVLAVVALAAALYLKESGFAWLAGALFAGGMGVGAYIRYGWAIDLTFLLVVVATGVVALVLLAVFAVRKYRALFAATSTAIDTAKDTMKTAGDGETALAHLRSALSDSMRASGLQAVSDQVRGKLRKAVSN